MKISRKQHKDMLNETSKGMYRYRTEQDSDSTVAETLDAILAAGDIEVEEPLTPGTWRVSQETDIGNPPHWNLWTKVPGESDRCFLSPIWNEADANLWAASKELLEAGVEVAELYLDVEQKVTNSEFGGKGLSSHIWGGDNQFPRFLAVLKSLDKLKTC